MLISAVGEVKRYQYRRAAVGEGKEPQTTLLHHALSVPLKLAPSPALRISA